jgi:hypothetical protein
MAVMRVGIETWTSAISGPCAEGMSGLRRDAASAHRQFEKRAVGVPIRVRRDSPRVQRQPRRLTLISARRPADPSERGHREARAGGGVFRASGRGAAGPTCLWRF